MCGCRELQAAAACLHGQRAMYMAAIAANAACYPFAEALREEAAEAERLAARDYVPPKTAAPAVVRRSHRRGMVEVVSVAMNEKSSERDAAAAAASTYESRA